MTTKMKLQIIERMKERRQLFPSDAKFATFLGISASQFNRVKKGDTEKVISRAKWISIARKLDVNFQSREEWHTALTPTYKVIYAQLSNCQSLSISGIMCDIADIGKTYTAKCYVKENENAVYIDCSQTKTKQQLVRRIAQEFGIDHMGRFADVQADLVFYLRQLERPLIILDEAGDLAYPAFLELKALWNATEDACGWYMMGADGLKVKMEKNRGKKKVGYAEIFSRFGSKYQKISPEGKDPLNEFKLKQTALVTQANASDANIKKIYHKTAGSLRRIKIEIQKRKQTA